MKKLRTYFVTRSAPPSGGPDRDPVTPSQPQLETGYRVLRGIVQEFARQHRGDVKIGADNEIAQTVRIQTTPALARALARVEGIGSVSERPPKVQTLAQFRRDIGW